MGKKKPTTTKINLQKVYFILCHLVVYHVGKSGQGLKVGLWRQELMQRPGRSAATWLAPQALLSLLS